MYGYPHLAFTRIFWGMQFAHPYELSYLMPGFVGLIRRKISSLLKLLEMRQETPKCHVYMYELCEYHAIITVVGIKQGYSGSLWKVM